ncbi:hypothetical protein VSR01_27725 [Actinacidiphila sp. DG2A-62]|uniref:hypothetical protein n=1 Tax=Actinacidiphila sp. DG2A-62 TaxID=3108821 RepID=UPI002DBFA879|nr:hypothetical protein [Actinacidiphila sp. DG2A-62]MEC3997090.1 hypothetical protein [Actinacidiphila sp. DG2A-62]
MEMEIPQLRANAAGACPWIPAHCADGLRPSRRRRPGARIDAPTGTYIHDPAGRLLKTPTFDPEDRQYLLAHRNKLIELVSPTRYDGTNPAVHWAAAHGATWPVAQDP